MKVKLATDYTVCRDGIRPESFLAGQEVDMPEHIAKVLIEDGRAIAPGQTKIQEGAPENKMAPGPSENKGEGTTGPIRSKRRA